MEEQKKVLGNKGGILGLGLIKVGEQGNGGFLGLGFVKGNPLEKLRRKQ